MTLSESSTPTTTEKPFGISQIRAHVPVILDLHKHNYDTWREIFETHCTSFGVIGLLDGSEKSTPKTEKQWKERDGLVKMWIYGIVSEELLDTILKEKSQARDLWLQLESLFHDNKEAQILQFENEIRTLEIGDKTVQQYCHKLKTLSELLSNLDSPISDRIMVMHMLNGLSDKFDSIINVIKHQTPFPSFTKLAQC
ncbi:PREDICTED: uncharacterized protein LOC104728825 [Camelina sativa]|uniref:Uncharacterized protein LOC104728825 n=1 Tax=Camelina sativa TaxID=90675 RepID=A0ABM0UTE9_CAMSA|nr:PREDICTED: uncharacterized protein LOC104728825 [Camelina sativa]